MSQQRHTVDTINSDQLDALQDELAALRRDNSQLLEDQAECIRLEASFARVRKLHRSVEHRGRTICAACSAYCGSSTDNPPVEHPCPTLEALDEPKEPTP